MRSTLRCWLMFGTWQPTSRERSLTLRSPSASCSSTQSRFGSASARAMLAARTRFASVALVASIASNYLSTCAITQMPARVDALRRRRPTADPCLRGGRGWLGLAGQATGGPEGVRSRPLVASATNRCGDRYATVGSRPAGGRAGTVTSVTRAAVKRPRPAATNRMAKAG